MVNESCASRAVSHKIDLARVRSCKFPHMRPSALNSFDENSETYASKTKERLRSEYIADIKNNSLVSQPVPPASWGRESLRVLQWNIRKLLGVDGVDVEHFRRVEEFVEVIFELDADVLVLQECGNWCHDIYDTRESPHAEPVAKLAKRLYEAGYALFPGGVACPTLLATRLPHEFFEVVPLDRGFMGAGDFAAVFVQLRIAGGSKLAVYGTHLNPVSHNHRGSRVDEIDTLLRHFHRQVDPKTPTLIVADFNQQRRRDYAPGEWKQIVDSMRQRKQPIDDGVCSHLEVAGFMCCLDSRYARRNWPQAQPPPPTHWTGTIIDYAFSRNLQVHGVYIHPNDLSDHLPVITDWRTECTSNSPSFLQSLGQSAHKIWHHVVCNGHLYCAGMLLALLAGTRPLALSSTSRF